MNNPSTPLSLQTQTTTEITQATEINTAQWSSPDAKIAYQTPTLTMYGQLDRLTLQVTSSGAPIEEEGEA